MRFVPTGSLALIATAFVATALTSLAPLSAVAATANTEFYSGKTVKLIVSSSPGGGYDTYSRVIARHMANFIPGEPDIIVQNMPGASGIKAGNYLFKIAEQDGSVIGGLQNSVPFRTAARRAGGAVRSAAIQLAGLAQQRGRTAAGVAQHAGR
jgi:Uncharacterized protein conserved in bacteria